MISNVEKIPFRVFTVTADIQATLDFLTLDNNTEKLRQRPSTRRNRRTGILVTIKLSQRGELTFKFLGCSKAFNVGERFVIIQGKIVPLEYICST